jgi:hypothetical protein
MTFLAAVVPVWVSVLFVPAFIAILFMLANTAQTAAIYAGFAPRQRTRLWWSIVGFGAVYYAYTVVLSGLGTFDKLGVPPPIFLYTTIPLLAFLLLIVYPSRRLGTLLQGASLGSLVRLHTFRLIGVFFFINLYYEALPTRFAILAGAGDILTALLAFWVAREADARTPRYRRLVLGWNLLGLADIVSVLVAGIGAARLAMQGDADALRILNIGNVPYCLIPAVAPALIIFLHVLVFRKLAMERAAPSGQFVAKPSQPR